MSDARRSERRTARLGMKYLSAEQWAQTGHKRREYDVRGKRSGEAKALQRAGRHGRTIIRGLVARIRFVRAAIHVVHCGHGSHFGRLCNSTSADDCREDGY